MVRLGNRAMPKHTRSASLTALAAATIFLPVAAHALDLNHEPFYALGEGATTGGEFVAQPQMQTIRMEWVLGYISGRNREAASQRDRLIGRSFERTDTVLGWLQSYCQAHSLDTLVKAADDLRADFQRHEER
jgi:hypothetical protein